MSTIHNKVTVTKTDDIDFMYIMSGKAFETICFITITTNDLKGKEDVIIYLKKIRNRF